MFERRDISSVGVLFQEYFTITLATCDGADDYVGRMQEVANRLAAQQAALSEPLQIHRLFFNLTPDYESRLHAFIEANPLAGLTEVTQWIIDTEVKLRTPIVNLTTTPSSSTSLNATQPRNSGGRNGGGGGRGGGGGGGGGRGGGRGGCGGRGGGGGGGPGGTTPRGPLGAGGAVIRGAAGPAAAVAAAAAIAAAATAAAAAAAAAGSAAGAAAPAAAAVAAAAPARAVAAVAVAAAAAAAAAAAPSNFPLLPVPPPSYAYPLRGQNPWSPSSHLHLAP
ncbi:unnamed protein product [Closterium sp. NIES-64]|nr:unnamed protein product [Closterium sp. NIES-64]